MSRSAVEFPGNQRIHIGLAVRDLKRSTRFYETLLGVAPMKERPGYAKFEPADPSVNLSLNQVDSLPTATHQVSHYGVQVKSSEEVAAADRRLQAAGFETFVEQQTTCCYAVQDKVWATDPDGNRWEVFVVLDADAPQRIDAESACCGREPSLVSCC